MGKTWQEIVTERHQAEYGTDDDSSKKVLAEGNNDGANFCDAKEDVRDDSTHNEELNTQATVAGAKPFGMGDIDPRKDGGSVAPKIEDEGTGDKSEVGESGEKEKAELKEQIEQYNKYVEEALKIEKEIQEIGNKMGIAKDEVVAAIVNEEDGFFHPATSPLVRNRLVTERSNLVGGEDKLKAIKAEYDQKLGDLDSVGEKIEAVREQINMIFQKLLGESVNTEEVTKLREDINKMKFSDKELQILQRGKVEARYRDMQEGLGADCAKRMFEISKSKKLAPTPQPEVEGAESRPKSVGKTMEEPVINSVIEEKPKIDLIKPEPVVAEPVVEAIDESNKVDFEIFSPTKVPVIETTETPEEQNFSVNDLKVQGVIEGSVKNGQRIDDIKKTLNGPALQMPTPGAGIDIAKPKDTKTEEAESGVEEIKDLQGNNLEVNYKDLQDGAGVEVSFPKGVPKEETTIPEFPSVDSAQPSQITEAQIPVQQETLNIATAEGSQQPIVEEKVQVTAQSEAPVAGGADQPKAEALPAVDVGEKKKGGFLSSISNFFKKGDKAEAKDVAQMEKDLAEGRKPEEEVENKG